MTAERLARWGAWGTLFGVLLSGPFAVLAVNASHPQPPWQNASVFAEHYHPIQIAPYLGGIVLIAALVLLMAGLHGLAGERERALAAAAQIFTAAFTALIVFNYVVQTAFLPSLVRLYDADNDALIAALSMSNPTSLSWGIEMWGWGLLGVATWLIAPVFSGGPLQKATRYAFVSNGPVSILGALQTVWSPGWILSPWGLLAFALWNLLLGAMMVLTLLCLTRRGETLTGAGKAPPSSALGPAPA